MDDHLEHVARVTQHLRDDPRLTGAAYTIEQRIVDDAGDSSTYHMVIADGAVTVHEGPAAAPDLTIEQDATTARLLRSGDLSTQTAFLTGRLTIDGDIEELLANGSLLAELLSELSA